jgi:hypothetical protein
MGLVEAVRRPRGGHATRTHYATASLRRGSMWVGLVEVGSRLRCRTPARELR